jgi:hypothetical protein
MLIKKHLRILAINPGCRYLGIAFFIDSDLREWRLKGLDVKGGVKKREKVIQILSDLIRRHRPNVVSIKALHPSRCSLNLRMLVSKVVDFCHQNDLTIFTYSIQDVEAFLLIGKRQNKKELARSLAGQYPELSYELRKESQNRNPYFSRLFEAVALGLVCYRQQYPNNLR